MSFNNHIKKSQNRVNLKNFSSKSFVEKNNLSNDTQSFEPSFSEENSEINIESNNTQLFEDNNSEVNYEINDSTQDNQIEDMSNIFNNEYSNEIKFNPWKIISLILVIITVATITISLDKNRKNSEVTNKKSEISMSNKDDKKSDSKKEEETKKEKYLFLGDSIFEQYKIDEFFKDYDVINSGFGGATTKDTLDKLESRVFKYDPTTIFLLIGTNDLLRGFSEEETFENVKKIIEQIQDKLSDVTINVLSIFPINNTDNDKIINEYFVNENNEKINNTNMLIKNYCKEKNITYIDMAKVLKDEEANLRLSYTVEGLHITDLGYHFITNELLKYMSKSK